MGLTKKSDGRYVVGKGIADGNEYKGSAAWRDIVIQYSGDGATEKSLEYLTFLKDYALYHSAQGNPVIPPNVQIWMSTANTMKAVEADDITVDGETVKIGACTWNGSDWSFAEPTPGGGGSSLPPYTAADKGKVLTLGEGSESETVVIVPEQTVTTAEMSGAYAGIIAGYEFAEFLNDVRQYENFVITVGSNSYPATYSGEGITSENNEYMIVGVPDGVLFADMTATASASYSVAISAVTPVTEPKWQSNTIYHDLITETINCSFNELKKMCKTSPVYLYSESENGVALYMLNNLNIDNSGETPIYNAIFGGASSLGSHTYLNYVSSDPDENMGVNK